MAVDLDKSRAARRETKGEGPKVIIGEKEYQLAVELPYEAIEALRDIDDTEKAPRAVVDLTRAILGEHYDVIKVDLSVDDMNTLIAGVMKEYGVDAPLPSSAS